MATSRTFPASKSTITLRRRGVLAVAGTAVIAAASLGATATAYAKKGGDDKKNDVRSSVACGSGILKLKAKNDDGGRREVEAEVDSNVAGQEWTLTISHDGKPVWSGKRTTAAPSGSFSFGTTLAADGTLVTPDPSTTTGTSTGTPTPEDTTTPSTDDSSSTATTDDSSTTSTSATAATTDDSGNHATVRRAASKGGDDKAGDDKGGATKPATGKHLISVTASLDTLNCGTNVTV
jgi:hypothetical protein